MTKPIDPPADETSFETFMALDVRIGTIVDAETFAEARKPAYKLKVDFGAGVGVRKSSAQITVHYEPDELIGKQVMGVVNFPARQIGPVRSEVLILGFEDGEGAVVLAGPDFEVPNGTRMS